MTLPTSGDASHRAAADGPLDNLPHSERMTPVAEQLAGSSPPTVESPIEPTAEPSAELDPEPDAD